MTMRGDELPLITTAAPGPRSQALLERLKQAEAPGLTLPGGVMWAEARGACVRDVDQNRYIDLTAAFGVAGIGHRHPAVVDAVKAQSEDLLHGMGDVFAHPARLALVETLKQLAPMPDGRVFLAGGGAEAVEIALKSALLATGKPGVLAWSGGYHGLTFGALAPTSRAAFRDPFQHHLSPYVVRASYPYAYRWPDPSDPLTASLEQAEAVLKAAQPAPIGAVVVEALQGREGEIVPPAGWLRGLRQLCDQYAALLIVDEIFTGWGRTGRLWAVEHEHVEPDLLCMGKGMTGGVPLAACVGRAAIMEAWRVEGEPLHTATFMGHPVSCAGANAAIRVLLESQLIEQVAERGAALLQQLRGWQAAIPILGEVRGRGFMIGLELVVDRSAKTPNPQATQQVVQALQRRGVLALGGGMYGNVISLTPPFVITDQQLAFALEALYTSLREA